MTWVIVVAVIVAFDLFTVVMLRLFIGGTFAPIAERYPPRDPAPDAIRRNFQSFRMGLISLGWSMHVAVDETHLHLTPAKFVRIVGARAMSVPWDAITLVRHNRSGKWATVRFPGMPALDGPAWCLDLAGQDATNE